MAPTSVDHANAKVEKPDNDTLSPADQSERDQQSPMDSVVAGENESSGRDAASQPTGPIRYIIEYFDELGAYQKERSDIKPIKLTSVVSPTVLEVITTITASSRTGGSKYLDSTSSMSAGRKSSRLRILSPKLINALRAVVDYYPGQSLLGDSIEFPEPYPFLVHHRHQLAEYKSNHPAHHNEQYRLECNEHIDILLNFLDESIGKSLRDEEERHNRGVTTFECLWLLLKPGQTVFLRDQFDRLCRMRSFLISEISGGVINGEVKRYRVLLWNVLYDGIRFFRDYSTFFIRPFDGEKDITALLLYPQSFYENTAEEVRAHGNKTLQERMIELGRKYWNLSTPCLKEYYGETVDRRQVPIVYYPTTIITLALTFMIGGG